MDFDADREQFSVQPSSHSHFWVDRQPCSSVHSVGAMVGEGVEASQVITTFWPSLQWSLTLQPKYLVCAVLVAGTMSTVCTDVDACSTAPVKSHELWAASSGNSQTSWVSVHVKVTVVPRATVNVLAVADGCMASQSTAPVVCARRRAAPATKAC